jgi:pyruvate formate lyase activating enzyme
MPALNNFYKKIGDEKIECILCRHYCKLKNNQIGVCGVNQNKDGKLLNLVYGKVSAINVDPIEKKPLYHFLPGSSALSIGTVGCNFKCPFCQNWQISQTNNTNNSHTLTASQIVDLAIKYNSKTIAYTYNEPTIFYPFAKDVALLAKEKGIKNIFVSNGFESPEVIDDMIGVIDAFNIDIKGFNSSYYKKVLKGGLDGVLDTLKRLKERGFWVECTTLIVPNDNDSDEELENIANFIATELDINTPWHISAFHPDYKVTNKKSTPIKTLQKAYEIGKSKGLNYIYMGNVALPSNTICPKCNSTLIRRVGYNITENNIIDGKCKFCQENIAGVWK